MPGSRPRDSASQGRRRLRPRCRCVSSIAEGVSIDTMEAGLPRGLIPKNPPTSGRSSQGYVALVRLSSTFGAPVVLRRAPSPAVHAQPAAAADLRAAGAAHLGAHDDRGDGRQRDAGQRAGPAASRGGELGTLLVRAASVRAARSAVPRRGADPAPAAGSVLSGRLRGRCGPEQGAAPHRSGQGLGQGVAPGGLAPGDTDSGSGLAGVGRRDDGRRRVGGGRLANTVSIRVGRSGSSGRPIRRFGTTVRRAGWSCG
jgi:hypothetical protein